MGAEFLIMDDNARPHRVNIVDKYLQLEDSIRMDWPAYSPDLNPIEHVWDMLPTTRAPISPLSTEPGALLDEWFNIPQDQIDNLILSMARRLQELQAALREKWGNVPQVLLDSLVKSMEDRCKMCISIRCQHTSC
ncbi:transposable element Tc3 transposase [Trichonephila clavipes]|nr:transposable element Tc3 transposase [Trichonephila clavipes]